MSDAVDGAAGGDDASGKAAAEKAATRRGIAAFLIFVGAVSAAVVAGFWAAGWDYPLAARVNPETEDAYADGEYTPLSPRVEGYLSSMEVDDNQAVKRGQVIARLEDSDYRAAVQQAQADVDAARAALVQLQEQQQVLELQVAQSRAQATGTRAEQQRAAEEAARQAVLLATPLGLRRNYDNAAGERNRLAADTRAQLAQTDERQRQIAVLQAQQARAAATVQLRLAQLDLARIREGYTVVRAPMDGTVGARQVRVGTLLQPGTEIIPMVPLAHTWLTANFTERQLTDMRAGQPARVRIDAFPDVELAGHVAGISPLTGAQLSGVVADNVTGNYTKVVQRIPVKVVLDGTDTTGAPSPLQNQLRPGMSALVRIMTDGTAAVRPAR